MDFSDTEATDEMAAHGAPNSVEARDAAFHMHSYTDARRHEEHGPLIIERGEGIRVFDNTGKGYIEAMSGLWSVALGFGEQRLVEAATRQMSKLPFYHTFSSKGHGPSADLAERLIRLAPRLERPMTKVLFTNSGSEANDTVVKMVRYHSNARGLPHKKKIIARLRGYHGVTLASGSLTGLPYNHASFDMPIDGIVHTSSPHHWREMHEGESEEAFSQRCADDLRALIEREGPDTIAAFIAEPVMGAGGVVVPPAGYWPAMRAVLDEHDILFVADEVICGFGRTGRWFGSQTMDLQPDIMVVSKQLSSSYLPISAVLMNDRVFGPIADESHRIGVFGHGVTGAGHPVAAAVALENLRIIEEEGLVEHAAALAPHFGERLHAFADHPLVGEVRHIGLLGALELVTDKSEKIALDKPGQLGTHAAAHMAEGDERGGVISRAMSDALAFCPPLIITADEVDEMFDITKGALDRTLDDLRRDGMV